MAAETLKKVVCNVMVETGTTADGTIKTASVSLGTLSKDSWDPDKALAIVSALGPCLSKTINSTEKIQTSTISMA